MSGLESHLQQLSTSIPANIRFGTSSWTYEGWKGTIYKNHYRSKRAFTQKSLGEYAEFPLFRTVGIDSTFYSPPKENTLLDYSELLPEHFSWVAKVWEAITIPKYAAHPRYGTYAGKDNPNFLDADLFLSKVLQPLQHPKIKKLCGPLVFQFQSLGSEWTKHPERFFERLDSFLAKLPKDFRYALEIRDKTLLSPNYFSVLNKHGATHCFNHWSYMPSLKEQMQRAYEGGGLLADFFVARLLTPRGVSYEEAVKKFSPYEEIREEQEEMRKDMLILLRRALARNAQTFILVNNRCEGYAPGTIQALAETLAHELQNDE